LAIIDGHRVPHEGANVHVSDLSFLRGFAVFENVRVEAGAAPSSNGTLHGSRAPHTPSTCPSPAAVDAIADDVHALVETNAPDVNAAQIPLSGSPSSDGVTFRHPTCIVTAMSHTAPVRTRPACAGRLVVRPVACVQSPSETRCGSAAGHPRPRIERT